MTVRITPDRFHQLMVPLGPFGPQPILAVATSGGPDSLALALLSHQWVTTYGGKVVALTVDHRLRPGSTAEAQEVNDLLRSQGIEHHILTWERAEGTSPQTAIQATAREARYQLLGQWCKDYGIRHLLTAHHAQDQLETFLIRLSKGSGLKGLTSIQGSVPTGFGRILRPLLAVEPGCLQETLTHLGQPFISDPSNENVNFTRVRWRRLLPLLAAEGLMPQTLQETLGRLNHAQRLLDQHVSHLIQRYVTLSPYGYIILGKEVCQESPEAIEEIVKRVLATIGVQDYPVRRQAVHGAMEQMKAGRSFTLGGCQVLAKSYGWQIIREPQAIGAAVLVRKPGNYVWDNRFSVSVYRPMTCYIAALGEEGVRQGGEGLKARLKSLSPKIPSLVAQTLPALWQEGKLMEPLPSFAFTPRRPLFPLV